MFQPHLVPRIRRRAAIIVPYQHNPEIDIPREEQLRRFLSSWNSELGPEIIAIAKDRYGVNLSIDVIVAEQEKTPLVETNVVRMSRVAHRPLDDGSFT